MAMYSIGDLALDAEDDRAAAVLFGLVLGEDPAKTIHVLRRGAQDMLVTALMLQPADHDRIFIKAQRMARDGRTK